MLREQTSMGWTFEWKTKNGSYLRSRNSGVEQIRGRSSCGYLNLQVLGGWFLIVQKVCEIDLGNASFRQLEQFKNLSPKKKSQFLCSEFRTEGQF